ncbi:hypothetical protein FG93_05352 [Bosea sp. LC85]|uniref:hypothetical protein n=1 Tax=Bosea sp. LC85 TaxID=1502851 RepID=UPI0004E42327|nr:hypothetical protein [Bosea sp. LC85]KFC63844.1 hypothetical protein FG93_05352 [Bosea sp. LC85]
MLKASAVFVVSLLVLVPICVVTGYAIGHAIAAYVFSAALEPDTYKQDRELFAGVYGIMFIGGSLYVLAAAFAAFRLIKAIRANRA